MLKNILQSKKGEFPFCFEVKYYYAFTYFYAYKFVNFINYL
jgi:hypothetical protein